MTRPNDPSYSNQDEQLADFTDRIMKGQGKEIESNVDADADLRGLEETVLHLKSRLPSASLDEAAAKQMLVRLRARIRREEGQARQPFWQKWLGPGRPQFVIPAAVLGLLIVLALVAPWLSTTGSSTTATGLSSSQSLTAVIVLTGLLVLILWSARRK